MGISKKTKGPAETKKTKPAQKVPVKAGGERELLAGELKALIPKLDEEGLAFLIEQAQVHLYNMQVVELNKTLEKNARREGARESPGKAGAKAADGFSEIKSSDSGSSYYVVYKTEWIMFTREEMALLTKIVNGEGTDLEIRERLFNWLRHERSDVLRSAGIADKFDGKIKSFAALLKKKRRLKKT
jgi:hypothetical protein